MAIWEVSVQLYIGQGHIVAAKLSIDIKIVAYFHIAMGVLTCLAAGIGGLALLVDTAGDPLLPMVGGFGLYTVEGSWQVPLYTLALGTVVCIAGLYVLKRRRLGWCVLLLLLAEGITSMWVNYSHDSSSPNFYSSVIWSILGSVSAAVLIYRRKQFFTPYSKLRSA